MTASLGATPKIGEIEEITVTTTKLAEDIKEVPLSIPAVTNAAYINIAKGFRLGSESRPVAAQRLGFHRI